MDNCLPPQIYIREWKTMEVSPFEWYKILSRPYGYNYYRLGKEYPGVYVEGCMSPKIFGLNIKPTKASITSGCTCSVQTYGIGEYDTCKMGCKYCYATIDHNLAKRIPENPNSELISGEITEPIKYVNNRVQISQELSLFD